MILSKDSKERYWRRGLCIGVLMGGLASTASAQDWTVDWHTVDGGGVLESETADQQWQLSGTIGQWDSTGAQALIGSGRRMTGGFWAFLVNPIDAIFRDRFDAPVIPRRYEIDSEQDN